MSKTAFIIDTYQEYQYPGSAVRYQFKSDSMSTLLCPPGLLLSCIGLLMCDQIWAQSIDPLPLLMEAEKKLKGFQSLHFKVELSGTGSRKGKILEINADVFIKRSKNEFLFILTNASVLKPMFDKTEQERVIVDGYSVNTFDFSQEVFIDRGAVTGDGKKYLGFSSITWQHLISEDPFYFSEKIDHLVYEGQADINGTLSDIILIKRTSYDSRIFINKFDKTIIRIENLNGKDETPGASVFNYSNIEYDLPIDEKIFYIAEKKQQTNQSNKTNVAKQMNLLPIGAPAPGFKLRSIHGLQEIELKDYLGKIVVLDFTASWCAPCKIFEKGLSEFYKKNNDRVVILALSYNETAKEHKIKEYLEQKKITYPLLLNAEQIAGDYNIVLIPTIYVLGTDGRILFHLNSYSEQNEKEMYKAIEAAMQKR